VERIGLESAAGGTKKPGLRNRGTTRLLVGKKKVVHGKELRKRDGLPTWEEEGYEKKKGK